MIRINCFSFVNEINQQQSFLVPKNCCLTLRVDGYLEFFATGYPRSYHVNRNFSFLGFSDGSTLHPLTIWSRKSVYFDNAASSRIHPFVGLCVVYSVIWLPLGHTQSRNLEHHKQSYNRNFYQAKYVCYVLQFNVLISSQNFFNTKFIFQYYTQLVVPLSITHQTVMSTIF